MNGLYDELRIALHAIWTRRWLALAVAWAVCLAGWLVVSQIPNKYESRARIFVQLQSMLPASMASPVNDQAKEIDRVRQTLTSAVNLQKVVRGTDLGQGVTSDRDVADKVAGLQDAIQIVAQQDNLFEITATSSSPKVAQQITQKLIDIFVEQNLAGDRDQTTSSLTFLDAQLDARQKQLADAEAKKADFQSRFLGMLPGTGSLDDRLGASRAALAQVSSDLAAAQSSLAAVNGQMNGTAATVAGAGGGYSAGPARARLNAIQGQLAEARARGFTDNHPDVVALNSQLAAAQSAARNEPLTAGAGTAASANPLYLSLKSMQADKAAAVAALMQRKAQIDGDLNTLQSKLADAPGVTAEQGDIERNYQVLKDQYDQLLTTREQTKLRSQMQAQTDAVKFNVVDPPTAPRTPASPNRPLLLTGVLIAGLAAGFGVAFALGQLKTTFATPGKLEKATGMPVIGAISEVVTQARTAIRRRQLRLFAGGLGALAVAYVGLLGVEFLQRGLAA